MAWSRVVESSGIKLCMMCARVRVVSSRSSASRSGGRESDIVRARVIGARARDSCRNVGSSAYVFGAHVWSGMPESV